MKKTAAERTKEEHQELHEKIWNCQCRPYLNDEDYCGGCQSLVLDFLNKHGAGVLTNDIKIDALEKEVTKLKKDNKSLKIKLESKIKRVEELKREISP